MCNYHLVSHLVTIVVYVVRVNGNNFPKGGFDLCLVIGVFSEGIFINFKVTLLKERF